MQLLLLIIVKLLVGNIMLDNLIYIADRLDESGFYRKASTIDSIIKKISQINSEETIIFADGDSEETGIIPELDPRTPNWRSYGESLMAAVEEDLNKVFKDIDWDRLEANWEGHGKDPLLKHKQQAEEALRRGDLRGGFKEYAFAIHYIDPLRDITGFSDKEKSKKINTFKRINDLRRLLSPLLPD